MTELVEERRSTTAPIAWASTALVVTGVVAVLSKTFGTVIAPGLHGIAEGKTIDFVDTGTAALAYSFAALLVALVCGASFELAKTKRVPLAIRGSVVAFSGLVVALASPAVVARLSPPAAFALSVVTSLIVFSGGVAIARAPHTRALGSVLVMLAVTGGLRPASWMLATQAGEHANMSLYNVSIALTCAAIVLQAVATLFAAIWLATRSLWAGRVAANVAVIAAFGITYLAMRETENPSAMIAVLRTSMGQLVQPNLPFGFTAIGAFLVPASILLGLVSLFQRAQAPAVSVALALALVASGSFDVPLQALAAVASAQWAMLAMADDRGLWSVLMRQRDQRSGVQQPTSPESPSA